MNGGGCSTNAAKSNAQYNTSNVKPSMGGASAAKVAGAQQRQEQKVQAKSPVSTGGGCNVKPAGGGCGGCKKS